MLSSAYENSASHIAKGPTLRSGVRGRWRPIGRRLASPDDAPEWRAESTGCSSDCNISAACEAALEQYTCSGRDTSFPRAQISSSIACISWDQVAADATAPSSCSVESIQPLTNRPRTAAFREAAHPGGVPRLVLRHPSIRSTVSSSSHSLWNIPGTGNPARS